jgi:hypothetical protein
MLLDTSVVGGFLAGDDAWRGTAYDRRGVVTCQSRS